MATKELYHIITFSNDSGEDEKPETPTLSDAIKAAKAYLATGYYSKVKIYHCHELKRHYLRLRNGKVINLPTNKPQATETPQNFNDMSKCGSSFTKDEWDDIVPDEQANKTVKQVAEISSLIQKHGFHFCSQPGNAQLWMLYKDGAPITDFMAIPQLWQWLTDYDRKTTPQSQNKCRVSSVLATAHELYNAAFIGSPNRIY